VVFFEKVRRIFEMIYINENIEYGSWSWDIPNKKVTFSPNWFKSLGYEVPQNLNQDIDTWENLINPEDINNVKRTLKLHLDEKIYFYQCVNRLLMNSGEYRENLDVGIVIIRNSSGDPLKMIGVDIDLSKTKYCKKDLEDNSSQYNLNKLTNKEIDVCELIKKGYSRNEIGEISNISPNTVKTHEKKIFEKFKVPSRNKLTSALFKNDLVEIRLD
jgi:DNA-binding CsgD family transcriptional regulator